MTLGAALGAVAALSALLVWLLPDVYRGLPLLQPDSHTYLAWDVTRPLFYPLLLSAVRLASPELTLLGPLQFAGLMASTTSLAAALARHWGAPWLAVACSAAILLHPQVVSYAFTALPETVVTSLLMLHLVATMRLVAEPRRTWAACAALALAAAVLSKPVAVSFLAGGPVLVAALWRAPHRLAIGMAWIAAFALPLILASTINAARFGVFSPQMIGGFSTMGVAGTFVSDDVPLQPATLKAALLEELRPLRDELRRLDSMEMYYFYSSTAYHTALERSRAVVVAHIRSIHPEVTAADEWRMVNDWGQAFTRAAIRQAPDAYVRHVVAHLYGLWLMPLVQNAAGRDAFERRLQEVRATAPTLASEPLMVRFVPAAAYWPVKGALVAGLASGMFILVCWVWRPRSIETVTGAYAALLVHGYFLLTAAAQTGLPRYALTVWPLVVLVMMAVAACVGGRLAEAANEGRGADGKN